MKPTHAAGLSQSAFTWYSAASAVIHGSECHVLPLSNVILTYQLGRGMFGYWIVSILLLSAGSHGFQTVRTGSLGSEWR
jgi:hypothetical protein